MSKCYFLVKIFRFFRQKCKALLTKIFSSKIGYFYFYLKGVFKSFNTLTSDIEGAQNVLVLGKGASLKDISHKRLSAFIERCDYRILASSVDINNHNTLEGFEKSESLYLPGLDHKP